MSAESASLIRFKYEIELLEDLHAGSGLGSVWVDRTLARDQYGKPFIPASHVKGVWRDAMVRLVALGVEGFNEKLLNKWFGAAPKKSNDGTSPQRGCLYCPQLEPESDVESLVWMQTARKRFSRRPADDTLRSTEYIPAGSRLTGYGFFTGQDNEFEALKKLMYRVDRYGGNRSRGDGRIRVRKIKELESGKVQCPGVKQAAHGIRLLLKAHGPVRVPRTGSPGNIIESDTRIPGRMLAGAIIRQLLGRNAKPETLFSQQVAIGDALPLNPAETEVDPDKLAGLQVLPAPLEYRAVKKQPVKGAAFQHRPDWASGVANDGPVSHWQDLLAPRGKEDSQEDIQIKRLPAGMYIQRIGTRPWRAYRQHLELAMRNRRGSDFGPGDNPFSRMDNELFSNEQIPLGTCFVADIQPMQDKSVWEEWLKTFANYIENSPFLFIGRGGTPVEIVAVNGLKERPTVQHNGMDHFRLTLISDAIIRTEWLGFHQRLTLKALCDALDEKEIPYGTSAEDVSEARIDRAFNAATRLPRPSVMMLRAGSSIVVRGDGAEGLREKLEDRDAIGERQHEGLGRFRLDLDVVSEGQGLSGEAGAEPQEQVAELRTESVARFATQLASTYAAALKKPSTSQLGSVRARLDAIGHGTAIDGISRVEEIRMSLLAVSNATVGGRAFAGLAKDDGPLDKLIKHAKGHQWSIEDVRLAWRLMLARVPRKMDPVAPEDDQDDHEAENEEQS